MIVQAEAARSLLEHHPARAADAAHAVEQAGVHALAGMRDVLGVLRSAGTRAPLTPAAPGRPGWSRRVTIRVVIVDDQHLVRAGFRMILDTQPDIEVVGEATNGAEAVAIVQSNEVDVVLMDIRMEGVDGIKATRRIKAGASAAGTWVLILTTFDLDEYVYDGCCTRRLAVSLLKDAPPEQLTAADAWSPTAPRCSAVDHTAAHRTVRGAGHQDGAPSRLRRS